MSPGAFGQPLPGESTDPRRPGGDFVAAGGPQDRHAALIDPTDAVLLDDVGVVLIEPHRGGQTGPPALAMTLAGRVNKTEDRSRILYLFDEDGAAAIVSELIALASRIGPDFLEQLLQRIATLRDEGAT